MLIVLLLVSTGFIGVSNQAEETVVKDGEVEQQLVTSSSGPSNSPEEEWNKTFGKQWGDTCYSVQQIADGGFIITGSAQFYGLQLDVWLIKTDAEGNEEWNKTFGETESDVGHSVQQTTDAGFIIVGGTRSYGAGRYDVWLVKTDSNGDEQWNKTFGGTNSSFGKSAQQTTDGGYIIIGSTKSYGAGDTDGWLIKVASENQPPSVEFVNPREGYFHFSGIPLLPTPFNLISDTLSLGGFRLRPIQVYATDNDNEPEELMVSLFIDEEDKGYGNWNPETGYYEWQWAGKAFGEYHFKVKARDIYGRESWESMDVWNFCLFS